MVKRRGRIEKFDERKVYASCYAACMTCNMKENDCEMVASKITAQVKKWVRKEKRVTSAQIFRKVVAVLKKIHKPAAFMYETHMDVS